MEGMAWGHTGQRMLGIGCHSIQEPGRTGMATPGALLAQSFRA